MSGRRKSCYMHWLEEFASSPSKAHAASSNCDRMKKSAPAANPEAYVAALTGWRRRRVQALRSAVLETSVLSEVIKWGNLVYFSNGPVLMIRAEDERVLFGFWRGQRLQAIDPRLKRGGKYEMATLEIVEKTRIGTAKVAALVKEAVALNARHGDPTNLTTIANSAA